MCEPIDRLCDALRIKLHGIDRRLEALKSNGSGTSDTSRHRIESQIVLVAQRIHGRRSAIAAASARVTAWTEGKRSLGDAAQGREDRSLRRLNDRADGAETYALAAFELAAAAADAATNAALEALLARREATEAALPARTGDAPVSTPAATHAGGCA
ncbi:hypothetical protein OPKNFCMD_6011 [Methylobacterium crusticola]|uniref:Uncharacterized protein n=1 Tax=Methylobacterium crusticola TaxID=1697972 RepID=A0ABQ4R8W9_9HYPH|nr:hypothetical protein [Methylobacterium crusticola]GJD53239.1 hypothetical protein OPKNFCMD_6011 [Methylobacterium crusticola]